MRPLLYAAAALRSFVTGLVGVLLGLYLARLELDAPMVGLVVGSGLAGSALGTAVVAARGERWGRRTTLLATAVLSAVGLGCLTLARQPLAIIGAAFFGMVNAVGRDRGPAQTLEQSLLADSTRDADRTAAFVRYTLAQDVAGALGALCAAAPSLLERLGAMSPVTAQRTAFGAAAALSAVPLFLYARLPVGPRVPSPEPRTAISPAARRRVASLSALFALDSLGGGFLAGSIVAYWFFRRFGLSGEALGLVFFTARLLNASSYVVAGWLAARIGLVRTMVFTHLPSSLVLFAIPFVSGAGAAVALFLVREAVVQMDVPARQAYVADVTEPGERTWALGVTGLVRNVGWALGPPLAGTAMGTLGLGAPLIIGAGLKLVYDLALYESATSRLP